MAAQFERPKISILSSVAESKKWKIMKDLNIALPWPSASLLHYYSFIFFTSLYFIYYFSSSSPSYFSASILLRSGARYIFWYSLITLHLLLLLWYRLEAQQQDLVQRHYQSWLADGAYVWTSHYGFLCVISCMSSLCDIWYMVLLWRLALSKETSEKPLRTTQGLESHYTHANQRYRSSRIG